MQGFIHVDMNEDDKAKGQCNQLLLETAKALDAEAFLLLYKSVHRNNLPTYVEHTIKE